MPIRRFTRDELDEMGLPHGYDGEPGKEATIVQEQQLDTRRWVSVHEVIFRAPDDGKLYAVAYQQGLTESQDDTDPWFYDDTVTADEMEPHEVTVTTYRKVAG